MDWIKELLDTSHTRAGALLEKAAYPWEILGEIKEFILSLELPRDEFEEILPLVWAARDAVIAPTASITGPCVIGRETEVRHCAFIRGSALVGDRCVVGNSTELKNVILFDNVQVPHYNYVGDSVLGYKSHMGAGAVTSNVKSDKSLVTVRAFGQEIPTGRKKFGAILGDFAEIGCNSVLNPGSIIGRRASVYPTSCVRGFVPEGHIYKDKEHIVARRTEG